MKGSGIGGQAVMEGVMMKNGSTYAVAVRKPDGDIVVDTQKFKKTFEGVKFFDLPIARGVIAFIDSLRLGVGTLMYSADFAVDEEEEGKKKKDPEKQKKEDQVVMTLSVILAVVLAIGIFMVLPYFLSQLLKKVITSTALLTLCEGLIRIILFVGYIAAISCMKDIKRVFMYHGAEHKSINCIENGLELNVANVRKSSRRHKRCGTSFLLIVMLISIIFFMFIRVETAWLRIVLRLLLIPVIAGVSYEFIRLAGKSDSKIVDILSKPGLALQSLTTSEPDDDMIEVAIASVEAVFNWRKFLDNYDNADPACELTGTTAFEMTDDDRSKASENKKTAGQPADNRGKDRNKGKNKGGKNRNQGNSQNRSDVINGKKADSSNGTDKQDKQSKTEDLKKSDINTKLTDLEKQITKSKPEDSKNQGAKLKPDDQKKQVTKIESDNLKEQEVRLAQKGYKDQKDQDIKDSKHKQKEESRHPENNELRNLNEYFNGSDASTTAINGDKSPKQTGKEEKTAANEEKSSAAQNSGRLSRSDRIRGIKTAEPVTDDEDDEFLKALDKYFDEKKD
ncbi:MAG: DUF1385 domain-containing protein [Lachnospiraceae bacterium]|nr:DUF1385 domain-containing protein [Lachnospiraceae bacterium]